MIRLSTLEQIDLRQADGARVNSVLQQPGRFALLVRLAMARGHTVRRDTLLGLFWPDSPEERARHRLSQAIYHLRKSLGRDVIHGRGASGYGISRDALHCDAVEFLDALDDGDRERALGLYTGDFLPGFFAEHSNAFQQWMEVRRAELRRAAAEAALELAEEKLSHDPMGTAAAARRALQLVDFGEPSVRRVIRLLGQAGDRVGALEAYDDLCRRLAEEFDAEPSPETTELVQSLQEEESAAPGAEAAPLGVDEADVDEEGKLAGVEPAPVASAGPGRSRWWVWTLVVMGLAGVLGVIQTSADPAQGSPVPRVLVETVGTHADLQAGIDLSRTVTTETLARLAEVASFEVRPYDPAQAEMGPAEPSVVLRSDLVRANGHVRVTALLLDAQSLVAIGRGSREFPLTDDLEVADAVAAWLARFARERAGVWMKERRMHDSGADQATLGLIRSAVSDRERADSLAQVGSMEAAMTLLSIADSVLARAESEAPSWAEPSIQRAETALAGMWLALRSGGEEDEGVRAAVSRGLEHAERALRIAPGDPDAMAIQATLTYWLWNTTTPDSVEHGIELGDRAERQLRALVEVDPTRARSWTDLSALLQARGAFAEARWAAERAYRADAYLDRTGSITPRLFETALETGDLAAAGHWCDRMVERYRGDGAKGYCRMALVAWGPQSGPEQVEAARAVRDGLTDLSAQPWGPRLDALEAVVLARAGMEEEARRLLDGATAARGDPEVIPLEAWALLYLGKADSARTLLEDYIARRPHTRSGLLESRRFQGLELVVEEVGSPG